MYMYGVWQKNLATVKLSGYNPLVYNPRFLTAIVGVDFSRSGCHASFSYKSFIDCHQNCKILQTVNKNLQASIID